MCQSLKNLPWEMYKSPETLQIQFNKYPDLRAVLTKFSNILRYSARSEPGYNQP
jgi:hypothetical protein